MDNLILKDDYVIIKPIIEKNKETKAGLIIDVSKNENLYGEVIKFSKTIDYLEVGDIVYFNKRNSIPFKDEYLIVNGNPSENKILFKKNKN